MTNVISTVVVTREGRYVGYDGKLMARTKRGSKFNDDYANRSYTEYEWSK